MKFIFIRVYMYSMSQCVCVCECTLCTLTTEFSLPEWLVSHSPRCQLFVWFYFKNSVLCLFCVYSFIVSNTNIHTNKWIFFCLFVYFLSFFSLYLIVTSNKYHLYTNVMVSFPYIYNFFDFTFDFFSRFYVFRCVVDSSSTILTLNFV